MAGRRVTAANVQAVATPAPERAVVAPVAAAAVSEAPPGEFVLEVRFGLPGHERVVIRQPVHALEPVDQSDPDKVTIVGIVRKPGDG